MFEIDADCKKREVSFSLKGLRLDELILAQNVGAWAELSKFSL